MRRVTALILILFLGSGQLLRAQDYSELSLALAQGKYSEVVSKGRLLIDSAGPTGKLLELVAIAHEGLEQREPALECYQRALPLSTDSLRIQNSIGRCLVGLGRSREASAVFITVLEADTTNFFANNQLAKIYYSQSNYVKAISIYSKLAAMDTTNYVFYKLLGDCYSRMEKNSEAIDFYTKGFKINPRDAALGVSLAICHLKSGLLNPTLAVIDEAQRYDSLNVSLLRYEGICYMYKKEYEKSDSLFYKLVEMGDTTFFTLSRLGQSLLGRNYIYKAIKPLEQAYVLDSTDYDVLMRLAYASYQVVGPEKGLLYYDKLEAGLQPEKGRLAAVFSGRADIYYSTKNYDAAQEWYKKAYATDPANLLYLANMGRSLYYNKEYAKSKRCYLEFVETYERLSSAGHNFMSDPPVMANYSMIKAYLKELEGSKDSKPPARIH